MLDFQYMKHALSLSLSSTCQAWFCGHIRWAPIDTSLSVGYIYFSIAHEACVFDLPGKVWKPPRHSAKGKWQYSPFLQAWEEECWGGSAWQAFRPRFNYPNKLPEKSPIAVLCSGWFWRAQEECVQKEAECAQERKWSSHQRKRWINPSQHSTSIWEGPLLKDRFLVCSSCTRVLASLRTLTLCNKTLSGTQ